VPRSIACLFLARGAHAAVRVTRPCRPVISLVWNALLAPPKPSSGIMGPFGQAAWQADAIASEPRCRSRWGSTLMTHGRNVALLV
jgi:hypothetical protein